MLFRVEHGSSFTVLPNWEDVLRIAQPGDSVFRWVPSLGWLFWEEV